MCLNSMHRSPWIPAPVGPAGLLPVVIAMVLSAMVVRAGDLDELFDLPRGDARAKAGKKGGGDDLADNGISGGTPIRLVPFNQPDGTLAGRVFWRSVDDCRGVETFPVKIQLDGKDVIAPRMHQDEKTLEVSYEYPTEGTALFSAGRHVLQPGNITITQGDKLASDHPAAKIAGDKVCILCAPVRLDAVDSGGRPVPIGIRLNCGRLGLLREEAKFNPLTIWLPVGVEYQSSLGSFTVAPDGQIQADPATLPVGVRRTDRGLRLTVPAARAAVDAKPLVARPSARLTLLGIGAGPHSRSRKRRTTPLSPPRASRPVQPACSASRPLPSTPGPSSWAPSAFPPSRTATSIPAPSRSASAICPRTITFFG